MKPDWLKQAEENGLVTDGQGVNRKALLAALGAVTPSVLLTAISEREFQNSYVDFAHLCGWDVIYFRPARVLRGGKEIYETPIGGDGKGWPDTIAMRLDRLVAAELKREGGKATPEQIARLEAFNRVPGCQGFIWQPSDWPIIEHTLK